VDIQLSLTVPAKAAGPAPVIMEFGYGGATRAGRVIPVVPGPTWQQQVLAKNWGYASLIFGSVIFGSVQADNGQDLARTPSASDWKATHAMAR
jgi:hypothetical protein